jgi:hypothetical protein
MKVGEFYRNRFNHYISQVTNVTDKVVTLTNVQGVSDNVKLENFHTNWSEVNSVYQFETTIRSMFPNDFKFIKDDDALTVYSEAYEVPVSMTFSIEDDYFWITMSDCIMGLLEVDYNSVAYNIEDALEVIYMIADQLE